MWRIIRYVYNRQIFRHKSRFVTALGLGKCRDGVGADSYRVSRIWWGGWEVGVMKMF